MSKNRSRRSKLLDIIHHPHDSLFRAALGNIAVARSFFNHHLPPKILDTIQFDSLQVSRETFVDKNLSRKIVDILYKVKSKQGKTNYLYILTEAQSDPDKDMLFRLLEYTLRIMKHHKASTGAKDYPVVYPILRFYFIQNINNFSG